MKKFSISIFFIILSFYLKASERKTFLVEASYTVATFNQPTSSYYLFSYGPSIRLHLYENIFFIQALYLKRPSFSSVFFEDDEHFLNYSFGTLYYENDIFSLLGFYGLGKMKGSIWSKTNPNEKSSYKIDGYSFGTEILYKKNIMTLSLGHEIFLGIKSKYQLKNYVAWPFNFVYFKLGFLI